MSSACTHQKIWNRANAARGRIKCEIHTPSGREMTFSGPIAAGMAAYRKAFVNSSVIIRPAIMLRMISASVCSRSSPASRLGCTTRRRYNAKLTAAITSSAKMSCEAE